MPVARPRQLSLAAVAVSLVVLLSTAIALLSPPADGLPPGSSLSRDPGGAEAAYLTLQALGYSVRRSFDPLPSVPAPGVSVRLLADPLVPASDQDRRAAQAFAASGGTLLVTGCQGLSFLRESAPQASDGSAEPRLYRAGWPSPLTAGVPIVSMADGCGRPSLGVRYVPVYGDDQADVVWLGRIGAGRVVWWADSTPLSNSAIDRPGHLELLLNTLGPRGSVIVWDEFYHGQPRSLWSYAARTPLPLALVQIVVLVLVAAAMYTRRSAPVRERFVQARTSTLEFVDTMAGLYVRTSSAGAAVATARARLRRLLLDLTGLSGAATDAQLALAAEARLPFAAGDLAAVLDEGARAESDAATTADSALPLVRRMQALAQRVHGGG